MTNIYNSVKNENYSYYINDNILESEVNEFLNKNYIINGENEGIFLYSLKNFRQKYPFISNDLRNIIYQELSKINKNNNNNNNNNNN